MDAAHPPHSKTPGSVVNGHFLLGYHYHLDREPPFFFFLLSRYFILILQTTERQRQWMTEKFSCLSKRYRT